MVAKKPRKYDQDFLINDGSVHFNGTDPAVFKAKALAEKKSNPIAYLKHPEVRYEVTDHCNAECLMCPRDLHEDGRAHGIMDLGKYKKSIDEVIGLGCERVVLTGFGEPLIDPTLEEKIAYAVSRGLHTYIITNASLLSKDRAESLIKAGLHEMRVSFHAATAGAYERVMKNLNFETAQENILNFLQARKELQSATPRLQLNFVVVPENEAEIRMFKEKWEPLADAIEIWKSHNFGDGKNYRKREESGNLKKSCGRPKNGPLQIQWNGEVIPCCFDYNNQIVLGNAFEQPVLDVLNGEKYCLLRAAHQEKKFEIFPYCNQCDQLLARPDVLVYSNRHNYPSHEAVRFSNTDLYDLERGVEFDPSKLNEKYRGNTAF
jgi:MoaA/NifB/PqqE/SkfB family radical SAM enzyme